MAPSYKWPNLHIWRDWGNHTGWPGLNLNKSQIINFINIQNKSSKKLRILKKYPISTAKAIQILEKWWDIQIDQLIYKELIIDTKDTVISLNIQKNDIIYVVPKIIKK